MAGHTATLAWKEVPYVAAAPKKTPSPPLPFRNTLWLAPFLGAALLYVCFFPVAFGWLAFVALVPWLCLVRLPGKPRRLYLATYFGAVAFYGAALQWARVADPRMYITWIALTVYISVYIPLVLYLVRRLERLTSLPLIVTFPAIWVSAEFLRWGMVGSFLSLVTGSHQHDVPGGFSWYFLGHSQHDFLPFIQIADLGGVYLVSFLVACVNVVVFEALYVREGFRRVVYAGQALPGLSKVQILTQAVIVLLLLGGTLAYGAWRMSEPTIEPGPRVALMQCNVDQRIRLSASAPDAEKRKAARQHVADHFCELAALAAKETPDLIVSPETSYPGNWEEFVHGHPVFTSRRMAQDLGKGLRTPILLGMNATIGEENGEPLNRNSAILIDREGTWSGRYDKIHRVPFGEYVPFRETLPILNKIAPYDYDYSVAAGKEFTRFALPAEKRGYTFGVVICYEDTDPAMTRPYARGEKADFLLNISNDGWFDGTEEHDQHLAICRFRAIETRRAIGRAVNMGITAIVDSNGRVLAPKARRLRDDLSIWEIPEHAEELSIRDWHKFKQQAGVLVGRMPIDSRSTVYAQYGDAFAMGCGVWMIGTFVYSMRRRE
jgi:apolipoprotein N-acyltransferase